MPTATLLTILRTTLFVLHPFHNPPNSLPLVVAVVVVPLALLPPRLRPCPSAQKLPRSVQPRSVQNPQYTVRLILSSHRVSLSTKNNAQN